MSKHVVAGLLIGVPAAVAGLVFGIPGMVVAILAIALVALIPRLPAVLAGGLVGLGGTWLILLGRQAWLCAQRGQVCGGTPTDMIPWLAFAVGVVLAGIGAGGYALVRARSRRA